jgi:hypothetical protein
MSNRRQTPLVQAAPGMLLLTVLAAVSGCDGPGWLESLMDGPEAAESDAPRDTLEASALDNPGPQWVDEDQLLRLTLRAHFSRPSRLRVFAEGLPPGARWDEPARRLTFRPDFIQGGRRFRVTVTAVADERPTRVTFDLGVRDTIHPPWPKVTQTVEHRDHTRLLLAQRTDSYLDSPGYAGRSFEARVVVPRAASAGRRLPVRIFLHGLGGSPHTGGSGDQFRIYPSDAMNTYWWGYSERLPGAAPDRGRVPAYTQRRVLHLLEWLLRRYPGADPERVVLAGKSMGGAGAKTLGLLRARHFAGVAASFGQAVPRNHRRLRLAKLTRIWGEPTRNLPDGVLGMGVWDLMDLTRALEQSAEARDQWVHTRHGKDDPIIHFGAMVQASPLTGISFYESLRRRRVGHLAIWDEAGHGGKDPLLGHRWWLADRCGQLPQLALLRRDLPFPAFSHSSADQDPGRGWGTGRQRWDPVSGYAGQVGVAGDCGWDGDLAGARNRSLLWDPRGTVDRRDRLVLPLRVASGRGEPPPWPGYPAIGQRLDRRLPVVVDVTPRRVRSFACRPGETVRWAFGPGRGTVTADASGAVTVPRLPLTHRWTRLVLTRY